MTDLARVVAAAKMLAVLVPDRDRDLVTFDLETTGFDGRRDYLLEVSLARLTPDGEVTPYEQLYCPPVLITKEIEELTGISQETVKDAPIFDARQATILARGLEGCDFGGFNVQAFDLLFLAAACARVGVTFDYSRARVVDWYAIWKELERQNLSTFVRRFAKRDHAGAHRATADVLGTLEGGCGFLEQFPEAPRSVRGLHDLCFGGWIDCQGKFVWGKDGRAVVNFGTHRGKPAELVDPSFFRWMTRADFMPDAKDIAERILIGRPPVRRPTADGDDAPF